MIATPTCRNDYNGTGSIATYSFAFPIVFPTELVVLETTGITTTTMTLNSDYTVTQNQDISTGGTVTLTAGNLATGTRLTILRAAPLVQNYSFDNNNTFYPSDYESALDALEKQVQQLNQIVSVCLQAPQEEIPGTASLNLPPIATRANSYVGFDANGNLMMYPIASESLVKLVTTATLPAIGYVGYWFYLTDTGQMVWWNAEIGAYSYVS